MAEGLLRHRLEERGVEATVSSIGLLTEGRPASDHAVDVLGATGVDITAHRSRRMTAALLDADLVLAMERRHVREAVALRPDRFGRVFTLKELVRLAERAPRRPEEPMHDWLDRVGAGRQPQDLLGSSGDDDVADPYGEHRRVYERTHAELDDLITRLVASAWGDRAVERSA
jgi:protein-tyrosine-phosphatase